MNGGLIHFVFREELLELRNLEMYGQSPLMQSDRLINVLLQANIKIGEKRLNSG